MLKYLLLPPLLLCGPSCYADLVYYTTPFTFIGGWSYQAGTITTDGSFTIINGTNVHSVIRSWDLTFTSPAGTYNLTAANSSVAYIDVPPIGPSLNLVATPTELVFPSVPTATHTGGDVLLFSTSLQEQSFFFEAKLRAKRLLYPHG